MENTGSWYQVGTDDRQLIERKIKGNFRLKGIWDTNPVTVNDRVRIILNQERTVFINEIEGRKNYIIRHSSNLSKQSYILATNLDQYTLVVTINYPETSTTSINHFLALAEAYRVSMKILSNRVDVYDEGELHYLDSLITLYTQVGCPYFKISVLTGEGVDVVREELKGRIVLLPGHSGVGKPALINAFIPRLEVKTVEISAYHNEEVRTTTPPEMFPVPGNGYVIDTPGIKGFDTLGTKEKETGHYLPETFRISANCKYGNCTHRQEPGCAIRKAVEEHYISESRYTSYLGMFEDKEEEKYRAAY